MGSTREFKEDSDKKSDALTENVEKKSGEVKEGADKKSDAFEAIDLKELVTKYREFHRVPIMERVKRFLDNPTEDQFQRINYRLYVHQKDNLEKNAEQWEQWQNLIAGLIKKDKLNTANPSEILLIGLAYLQGPGIGHSPHHALTYFTKVKSATLEGPNLCIALNYSGYIHYHPEMLNDRPTGINLLHKAIAAGSIAAYFDRGRFSEKLDDKQYFYQQGAAKGNAACYVNLSKIHHDKNLFQDAYHYLIKAAMQGRAEAMFNLGIRYQKGQYVAQDPNQAALFYRLAFTVIIQSRGERIRKILASNKDNFFVRYQLAMLEKNTVDISKLANENPSEFLECIINSDDLWDEVKPFLQKAVVEKIERLILDGLRFLRETSFDANVASIQLDYFLPKGLTKTFINLEIKTHLSEHDKSEKLKADKIAKLEQQKAEEIERCRLERERFIESVAAYKKIQDAKIKAADAKRKNDTWLYSQSDSSDDPGTELITRNRRVR